MISELLNSKKIQRLKRFIGLKTGIYLKLKRFTPSASEELRTATILVNNNIDCVIDVGANTGQFAESLYDFGYRNKVISFEPVRSCHDILLARSKNIPNWTIAERCAIGEKDDAVSINVAGDSVFSSLLKIQDWHSRLKPNSNIVTTEEVNLYRLDTILEKYPDILHSKRLLLKIDTQGYEQQVLEGAAKLLDQLVGIKIEIPLTPIYEDVGLTFYKTMNFLESHDFMPYSFNLEGVNLKTGRANTIDGLFLRQNN